ncbi:MAG: sigma-70 family RNA polymerase sigma factor [Lachnospiraceae bacterium]
MKKDLYQKIIDYIIENQNKFYRLAYSYTRNQEDALDVVQNSVCKALEHYEELKNENAVNTWIYRIVVNESLRTIKENKKHDLFKNSGESEGVYEERRFDVQDDLYEQINRLDKDTQTIIKLRFYEDLALQQIADIMEMNLNTVKAKLYRGLQALKVSMKEDSI